MPRVFPKAAEAIPTVGQELVRAGREEQMLQQGGGRREQRDDVLLYDVLLQLGWLLKDARHLRMRMHVWASESWWSCATCDRDAP